jgi:hypothetical protein
LSMNWIHSIWLFCKEALGMWVFYPIYECHMISFHLKNGYLFFEIIACCLSIFGICKMENSGWLVKTLLGMIKRSFGFVVLVFAKTTFKGVMILATFSISLSFFRISFQNANTSLSFVNPILLSILDASNNSDQFHIGRVLSIKGGFSLSSFVVLIKFKLVVWRNLWKDLSFMHVRVVCIMLVDFGSGFVYPSALSFRS